MEEVYRLNVDTLGILEDDTPTMVTITAGSTITIPNGLGDKRGFVVCVWNGARTTLMALDIRQRGVRVTAA